MTILFHASKILRSYTKLLLIFLFYAPTCCIALSQIPKIDSLQTLITKDREDSSKVTHLCKLCLEYQTKGNYDSSIHYCNIALQLAEQLNFKKGISAALNDIGIIYYYKADYTKTLEYWTKALKIDKELNDKTGMVKVLGNIGNIYVRQSDYTKALDYFLQSLKISEEVGEKSLMSYPLINIGLVYKKQGNYPKSLDYYLKGLKTLEEKKDKNKISVVLDNIGGVYKEQGDSQKALDYYFKALKMDEELGAKSGIAIHLGNIGDIYSMQNDYPKALEYEFKALKIDEELGAKYGIAINLGNIGNIYTTQKDYPKALDYEFKALKMNEELGQKDNIAEATSNIGSIYTALGEYKNAYDYIYRSLSLADSIGAMNVVKESYGMLSDLYEHVNIPLRDSIGGKLLNMEQMRLRALYYHKRYMAARDTLFSQEEKKQLVRKEMNYEFDKKEAVTKAEHDAENKKQKIIIWSVIGGLLLVAIFSVFMFNRWRVTQRQKAIIEKQKHIVDEQKKLVEEKNKDITDSINYAQRIQKALLASDSLLNKNLGEHFVLFKPKDIVSGDFYWATEVENGSGSRFYLAVCDSTGHGVPGAFMSLLNISFLNEAITEKGIVQPNEIFNHVRQRLIENLSSEGRQDGMDGILVCFDKSKNEISYAGANNAPYLMNSSLQELKTDSMPVGLGEKKDSFKHHTISFESGNILYLYTDGFADQFGGPKGKKFKCKQLNEKLLAISDKSLAEQKDILEKTFEDWRGSLEQVDDVLIIGIKV